MAYAIRDMIEANHITVAICTWNRAALLDQTLTRMRDLTVPAGLTWELLVVDNNSPDNTPDVIAKHAHDLPIRRIVETKQGLSHARNAALREAQGDWLVFTDDDVLVSSDWLAAYCRAIGEVPAGVAFLGGEIDPWFPTPPDEALAKSVSMVRDGFCRRVVPSELSITLQSTEMPFGANFAVRKSLSHDLWFDPALGVQGNLRILGEEVVFMKQLLARGYEGRWVEGASVRHYVDPARLTLRALSRSLYDAGRTMARRGKVLDGRMRILGLPLWSYRAIVEGGFHLIVPISWLVNRATYYSAFRDFWYYCGFTSEYFWGARDATVS